MKAIDHTFYGFTRVITHLECWENTRKACNFSRVLPTSRVGYHAGKPIESVVYCLSKPCFNCVVIYFVPKVKSQSLLTNHVARWLVLKCGNLVNPPQFFFQELLAEFRQELDAAKREIIESKSV